MVPTTTPLALKKSRVKYFFEYFRLHYMLYVFLLPTFTYLLIFRYLPIYGVSLAFKEFNPRLGIWRSEWVGFDNFLIFFRSYHFWQLIRNTIVLSLYQLAASFPIPIVLALLFNYTRSRRLKRFAQTITYAPHFISMVVLVGMIIVFLSPRGGFVNEILKLMGSDPIYFMGEPRLFRSIYVWSGVWQRAGWSSIIYIAVLAGVEPPPHEGAIIDGANKIKRIWYIDLPAILPTAVIILILNMGRIMNIGFEKVYLLQNPINLKVSEIIATYVYKVGLLGAQYSYSTAIDLVNNVINFIILISINKLARRISGSSLW